MNHHRCFSLHTIAIVSCLQASQMASCKLQSPKPCVCLHIAFACLVVLPLQCSRLCLQVRSAVLPVTLLAVGVPCSWSSMQLEIRAVFPSPLAYLRVLHKP